MITGTSKVGAQTDLAHLTQEVLEWFIDSQRDMEIDDFARPHVLDQPAEAIAETRKRLHGFSGRLGIHGPVITQSFISPDPLITEVIQRRYTQALQACEAIGATHMVIHSPFLFLGHAHPRTVDLSIEQAGEALRKTIIQAERAGCILVVENTWDRSPDVLLRLIRAVNSSYLRLSLDTGHAAVTSREGGLPADRWIAQAGDLLAHVHLNDTDGFADRHLPVGRGNINWYSVFAEVSRLTSAPRLIMEPHVDLRLAPVYREAAEWLNVHRLAI